MELQTHRLGLSQSSLGRGKVSAASVQVLSMSVINHLVPEPLKRRRRISATDFAAAEWPPPGSGHADCRVSHMLEALCVYFWCMSRCLAACHSLDPAEEHSSCICSVILWFDLPVRDPVVPVVLVLSCKLCSLEVYLQTSAGIVLSAKILLFMASIW